MAACASLNVSDGVGWLGAAATVPAFRGQGVHVDLLAHRIAAATELGCDILAATALPSGGSARNLSRAGFELGWTQVVVSQARSQSASGSPDGAPCPIGEIG